MRALDPVKVGTAECRAWAAYYRRDWPRVLTGALGMVWHGFGLDPGRTLLAAWYVLRANQFWAPFPDNDPDAARRQMARFYRLVDRAGRVSVDPVVAADLEVSWWQVHRQRQRHAAVTDTALVGALVDLYAYVYRTEPDAVRPAARLRVEAMELSDAWVAAGCRVDDPLLRAEERALIGSHTALSQAVVHRSS
ncbi:MAG TPA: hypothetical protein VIT20_09485 [Propionibacteriaceae bacterium]